jgi:hypothetical protein
LIVEAGELTLEHWAMDFSKFPYIQNEEFMTRYYDRAFEFFCNVMAEEALPLMWG